jgi:hypothetical protein
MKRYELFVRKHLIRVRLLSGGVEARRYPSLDSREPWLAWGHRVRDRAVLVM